MPVIGQVKNKNPKLAATLSLIPGIGQIYNEQLIKGIIFSLIFVLFLIELYIFGIGAIQNFITLGTTPREDHSLFLLIEGTIQIIIMVFFLVFYVVNIIDAKETAKKWQEGIKVNKTIKDMAQSIYRDGFAYLLIVPAYFFMTVAIIFPVLVTIFIALTNYDFKNIPPANILDWVGLGNFIKIFSLSSYRRAFSSVFSWTIIWTLLATTLQISLGIFTAVVMHQDFIKFRRLFGVILLLPWAVPAFITIMSFSNMFNDSVGAINTQVIPFINNFIPLFDIPRIAWKTDPFWTKTALIMIQGWLGFPYIYVMVTGILQSIPDDLYEAAKIDGAGPLKRFSSITLPMIFAVAAPIFLTQYTGNFNNFSIIYLFNAGGPGSVGSGAGATDILISWIFQLTTGQAPQYSIAAALTLIVSFIVISVSLIVFRRSNAFKLEGER